MKKDKRIILCLTLILFSFFAYGESGKRMYVSVDKASVKAKGSLFSEEIGELHYGDVVFVKAQRKDWFKIESDQGISGWITASALTKKKLASEGNRITTNAEELSLAGKGFNTGIEADFDNSDVSYEKVDEMEANSVDFGEAMEFIKEGNLLLGGKRL